MTISNPDQRPRIDAVCVDDAEVLALSVTRFIAAGYMTGDVACWNAAYDGAERVLGAVEGCSFVAAITGVMRALRAERSADWSFMPATCCRVTQDERRLLFLLNAARNPGLRDDEVSAEAARLSGTDDAPRLFLAARVAARALDDVQVRLLSPERQEEPPRRLALH